MRCERVKRQLGCYVDDELSAAERSDVDAHLESCSSCRAALAGLREMVKGIAQSTAVSVPDSLWACVERRLIKTGDAIAPRQAWRSLTLVRTRWAIAASVVLAAGLGMFGILSFDSTARASTIDFSVLLDALPLDAHAAFEKFLVRYDAKPTTPAAAQKIASGLNFDTPAVLPGGFRLVSTYELKIGGTKGIAAEYDRNGEFLAVVFHQPMKHEKFGAHQSYPCVIGEHDGHKVQVGDWKLVHFTDPTTCHCLLSRLDERTEMPAVMTAIAPKLNAATDQHRH